MVWIETLDRKGGVIARGSGVVAAPDVVAAPWSLVSKASSVRLLQDGAVRTARIEAMLESQGLARLSAEVGAPIELGRDPYPLPGTTVFAARAAEGKGGILSEGIVSGTDTRPEGAGDYLRTTIGPTEALEGGALINAHGELIGIFAPAGAREASGRALPIRYVKDLLALPAGTLPRTTKSPLLRLPAADRKWLTVLMNTVVRDRRPLTALELDRGRALIERVEPLVGAELAWAKVELGFGWLTWQRALWEDAVEAFTFRRVVKSERRSALEKNLLSLQVLTPLDLTDADRIIVAIAAHEPFNIPGARIEANERWLTQRLGEADEARRRLEAQLWQTR